MKIINGKKIAEEILSGLKEEIQLKKLKPSLAIILIGHDPASQLYIQQKEQTAEKIGVRIKKHLLPKDVPEREILELIESLNQDLQINGILVQMPLPGRLSVGRIVRMISPTKDVDGFLPGSKFESPFIFSIWRALQETGEDLKKKKIVALVNSDIFGETLKKFFVKNGLKLEYIVGALEPGIKAKIKKADILITALGLPNFIKGSMIKQGVIIIDGGISRKDGKIVGDVSREDVREKVSWLSPVPGGLGPMTVAFLLRNVVLAAFPFASESPGSLNIEKAKN
jgi:methylenetetrahydrofolate dehydrogenase (NADP+)/methenyltetrahydrofolate cyclohydrolase